MDIKIIAYPPSITFKGDFFSFRKSSLKFLSLFNLDPEAACLLLLLLQIDIAARKECKGIVKPHLTCEVHKEYKEYQEHLLNYKNWCIVICTFLSVPLCLFCWTVNLNLAWTYYFTGILISSSVVPIAMSITWARATASAVICGVVGGCLAGMASWLSFASTYPGGLSASTFVKGRS